MPCFQGIMAMQVEKKYGTALRVRQIESGKVDMMAINAVEGAIKRRFPQYPATDPGAQLPSRPLEAAFGAIVSTALTTAFTGFASALPCPVLDMTTQLLLCPAPLCQSCAALVCRRRCRCWCTSVTLRLHSHATHARRAATLLSLLEHATYPL